MLDYNPAAFRAMICSTLNLPATATLDAIMSGGTTAFDRLFEQAGLADTAGERAAGSGLRAIACDLTAAINEVAARERQSAVFASRAADWRRRADWWRRDAIRQRGADFAPAADA